MIVKYLYIYSIIFNSDDNLSFGVCERKQVITSLVEFSVPEFFLGLIHSDDNLSFGVFERKKVITSLNF